MERQWFVENPWKPLVFTFQAKNNIEELDVYTCLMTMWDKCMTFYDQAPLVGSHVLDIWWHMESQSHILYHSVGFHSVQGSTKFKEWQSFLEVECHGAIQASQRVMSKMRKSRHLKSATIWKWPLRRIWGLMHGKSYTPTQDSQCRLAVRCWCSCVMILEFTAAASWMLEACCCLGTSVDFLLKLPTLSKEKPKQPPSKATCARNESWKLTVSFMRK